MKKRPFQHTFHNEETHLKDHRMNDDTDISTGAYVRAILKFRAEAHTAIANSSENSNQRAEALFNLGVANVLLNERQLALAVYMKLSGMMNADALEYSRTLFEVIFTPSSSRYIPYVVDAAIDNSYELHDSGCFNGMN